MKGSEEEQGREMRIRFVTGNGAKFQEATHILEGWDLEHVDLDLVEIQGTRQEVIMAKAKLAMESVQAPLILEDVSLCCEALGGMPGPYAKDFLKAITPAGLFELADRMGRYGVEGICSAAYAEPGKEPVVFEGVIKGVLVAPSGTSHHGKASFNTIVRPDGYDLSFGEMTLEERSRVSHRRLALLQVRDHLVAAGVA